MADKNTDVIVKIAKADLEKLVSDSKLAGAKEETEALQKKIEELTKSASVEVLQEKIEKAVAERKSIETTGIDLSGEVVPFHKSLNTILSKNRSAHIDGRKDSDWEIELKKACDDVVWMDHIYCQGNNGRKQEDLLKTDAFEDFTRVLKASPNTGLMKALDSTAGKGLEFIPTLLSSRLTEKVEVALRVMNQFTRFQMPGANVDIPRIVGFPTAFLGAILTAPTDTQVTTGKANYVAKKIMAETKVAYETNMDSVIPMIELSERQLVQAIARGVDNAAINGDVAGTLDTPNPPALDVRLAWDGLRFNSITANSFTVDAAGAVLTLALIRELIAFVDFEYSSNFRNMVFFAGQNEWHQTRGLPDVTTVEKIGSFATIIEGELKKIDAIDIIPTQHMPQDLDATGKRDGASTLKSLQLASKDAWGYGVYQNIFLENDRNISKQEIQIVGTLRADFRGLVPESQKSYGLLRNILAT